MAAWAVAAIAIGALSAMRGAPPSAAFAAAALLAAPGAATAILADRLAHRAAAWAMIAGWVVMACAIAAVTGGAAGAAAALFVLPPVLAARTGPSWRVVIACVTALAGLVLADALALSVGALRLGLFAPCAALAAIAFAGVWLTQAPAPIARQPAPVGDRLAVAAHELRTPLTHIIGFADMMRAQVFGPLQNKYAEYAAHIRESGAAMLETLNAILDLSRIEHGEYDLRKERLDLAALARAVAEEAEGSAAPKRVALSVDAPVDPAFIVADALSVRRILTNLVGNAVKFTPEGGRVTVRIAPAQAGFHIEVADTGPGVPHAARERLTQPFAQTELGRAAGGAGMGLALVLALTRLHGGAFDIDDAPGGGALMRVRLPSRA